MNPQTYEFEKMQGADPEKLRQMIEGNWKQFAVGEEFELHGVKFRIRKITQKDIVARPVKGAQIKKEVR